MKGHIILIKSLDSTDDYDTIRSTADMLVNAINTEAMVNVRLSFGTIIPELKEVSQSYKEAGMALDVGRIFYPERNILSYRELGIGRLIHQLPVSLCECSWKKYLPEIPLISLNEKPYPQLINF